MTKAEEIWGPARTVWNILSRTPVHFNAISLNTGIPTANLASLLIMMELEGWVEHNTGDFYRRSNEFSRADKRQPVHLSSAAPVDHGADHNLFDRNSKSAQIMTQDQKNNSAEPILRAITEGIQFIELVFQGISRKYLQLYLGRYWCFSDNLKWGRPSLLDACKRFRPIRGSEVRAFVTPCTVQFIHTEVNNGSRLVA